MEWQEPLPASLLIAAGLWMLLLEGHQDVWRQRRYERRLAERRARGTDAYFEELRALEAYPPQPVSSVKRRLLGACLALIGSFHIATILIR